MKRGLIILLISSAIMSVNAQTSQQNLDFSAVYQHFTIMEQLQSGETVTEIQWDELFNCAAYKTLIRREFKKRIIFQEIFFASYSPGYLKDVNEILNKIDRKGRFWTSWVETMLEAYQNVPKQKSQLIELIKEYEKLDLSDLAMKESARFLPDEQFENSPKIAFIIFNDSRGYDPIILSLNSFIKSDNIEDNNALDCMTDNNFAEHYSFQLLYAHEAFHYYRSQKDGFRYPENNDPYRSLIWIMNQIENEGIADQIDKVIKYFEPACYAETREGRRYMNYLDMQTELVSKMDSMFIEILNQPDSAKIFSRRFQRMIPRSGHQTGFYMCNAIIDELGEQSLKPIVRNPFAFFKLYQKAALKNEKYLLFSEDALECIDMLEEQYKL